MFNNKVLYLIAHAKPTSIDDFKHQEIKKLKPWLKKQSSMFLNQPIMYKRI